MNKIYENQNEHHLKNETEKIEISEKNKKLGEGEDYVFSIICKY